MDRLIGTVSMGVRTPIIETGDNLVDIVFDSVKEVWKCHILRNHHGSYIMMDPAATDVI